jgi:hypothetical protein
MMKKAEILAKNLTKSGYGSDFETIHGILSKLTEVEIEALSYNLYRTAEKCGLEAFECDELYEG